MKEKTVAEMSQEELITTIKEGILIKQKTWKFVLLWSLASIFTALLVLMGMVTFAGWLEQMFAPYPTFRYLEPVVLVGFVFYIQMLIAMYLNLLIADNRQKLLALIELLRKSNVIND